MALHPEDPLAPTDEQPRLSVEREQSMLGLNLAVEMLVWGVSQLDPDGPAINIA